jgi:hypothetical protein
LCEFFHGQAKERRPEAGARFKVETESAAQQLQREKSSGKGKEREKENIAVEADGKTAVA